MSDSNHLQHGGTPPHAKTQDQQTKIDQVVNSQMDETKAEKKEEKE